MHRRLAEKGETMYESNDRADRQALLLLMAVCIVAFTMIVWFG